MNKRKEMTIMLLILFFIIIIQSTLLKGFLAFGVKPNLVLVFIISLAVFIDIEKSAILGCLAGIFQDMLLGKVYGIYALVYLYIGILASYFKKRFIKSNFIFNMIYVYILSFSASIVLGGISAIVAGNFMGVVFLIKTASLEALLNAIVSIPIFPLLSYLSVRLKLQEI